MSNVAEHSRQLSLYILACTPDVSVVQRRRHPLPVAFQETPHVICGIARRIGYAGVDTQDPIVYRLMIQTTTRSRKMLPTFFILEQGIFYEYEEWKLQNLRAKEQDLQTCA